jgi:lipopolysaccharide transport protein LptA
MNKIILIALLAIPLLADVDNEIKISSDNVNVQEAANKVIFSKNLIIDSGLMLISAEEAIYDNSSKIIEISGEPSLLKSIGEASEFEGSASKIIFYNNDNVHLLGAAKMKYENMTITSNKIVFSPRSGFINSNK